jgi:hypothetical protein
MQLLFLFSIPVEQSADFETLRQAEIWPIANGINIAGSCTAWRFFASSLP